MRNPDAIRTCSLIVLLVVWLPCSCGHTAKAPRGTAATMSTVVLVPEDFISGEPWPLGLLPRHELQELLRRKFVFKSGNHVTVTGLCKEVTRATGIRVEWLPDDERMRSAIDGWHYGDVLLPPPSAGKPSSVFGPPCSIPLGLVLEHLVWLCSDAEQNGSLPGDSIWTAWVANDVMLLVRLPRKRFSSAAEVESELRRDLATETVEASGRDDKGPGLVTATIVLPSNVLAGDIGPSDVADPNLVAPWLPAARRPKEQKDKLAEIINLRPGLYDAESLAGEIGRASGMGVHWMSGCADSPRPGRQDGGVKGRFRVLEAESTQDLHALSLPSRVSLASALNHLLAWLTESGPGYDPPDHVVWVAWLGENTMFLISLPDAL